MNSKIKNRNGTSGGILTLDLAHTLVSACRRELEKRNHALFQLRRRELQDFVERLLHRHVTFSGHRSTQSGDVRAAADFLAKIVRQTANIRAFRAGNVK